MRVSELEGPLLDVWVAMALGKKRSSAHTTNENGVYWLEMSPGSEAAYLCARYSTDWLAAGPIIERECQAFTFLRPRGQWRVRMGEKPKGRFMNGPTLLVAAMRAFVAARFGNDVQLDTEDEPA